MIGLDSLIPDLKRFTILIVDQEAPMRRNVRSVLQALGFSNFRDAGDGDAGLRKIRSEKIDCIFFRWRLPMITGPDFFHLAKNSARSNYVPALILAERNEEKEIVESLGLEMDSYLLLPLLPQVVEETMAEALFKHFEPSQSDRHLQNAGLALYRGNVERAHHELDAAEKISSRNPLVSYFRRLVFEKEGRTEMAGQAIETARHVFAKMIQGPQKAREKIDEGTRRLSERDLEGARQDFERAFELDPENSDLNTVIGDAFLSHGYAREAEQMFKASITNNPGNVFLYNRLGIAYRKQKKFHEAIRNYQMALEIDPQEENLHYNLARAHLSSGDRENAAKALQAALAIFPDFSEAQKLLAMIQSKDNRH